MSSRSQICPYPARLMLHPGKGETALKHSRVAKAPPGHHPSAYPLRDTERKGVLEAEGNHRSV